MKTMDGNFCKECKTSFDYQELHPDDKWLVKCGVCPNCESTAALWRREASAGLPLNEE